MTYVSITPAYRSAVITVAPFPVSGAMEVIHLPDVALAPSVGRDIAIYLSEMHQQQSEPDDTTEGDVM